MKMNYEGRQRKELVATIAEITGEKAVYMKAPTYAYQIGRFTIERNGDLSCDDATALEELLPKLAENGFIAEQEPQENATNADGSGLMVTVPVTAVSLDNLKNLLEAKGALIKKALGISDISIKIEDDKVSFPWFPEMPEPDEAKAYTEFIAAICRVFLIRLGFIGDEYKATRRILLRNLSGNSAWKNGAPKKEVETDD